MQEFTFPEDGSLGLPMMLCLGENNTLLVLIDYFEGISKEDNYVNIDYVYLSEFTLDGVQKHSKIFLSTDIEQSYAPNELISGSPVLEESNTWENFSSTTCGSYLTSQACFMVIFSDVLQEMRILYFSPSTGEVRHFSEMPLLEERIGKSRRRNTASYWSKAIYFSPSEERFLLVSDFGLLLYDAQKRELMTFYEIGYDHEFLSTYCSVNL